MSELMKKISGQLTDINNYALGQLPFGITIEFTKLSDSDNPGGWIGSAPVKPSGQFDLFTAYDVSFDENVNYKIFKDMQLETQGEANIWDFSTRIAINDAVHTSLMQPYISGCVTIKGAVTLGPENIPAVAREPDSVTLEVRKTLFRREQIIASSTLDAYGKYCIELPLNLMCELSAGNSETYSFSKVFVTLSTVHEEEPIEKSGILDLSNGEVTFDFHIDRLSDYFYFKTEMEFISDAVLAFLAQSGSGTDIHNLAVEDAEMEIISVQTGLDIRLIGKIVYASKVAVQLNISPAHSYALVNENGTDIKLWPAIGSASYDQIRKNVAAHIIPAGGSEEATNEGVIEFEKENLYNTITQNGDTMGAVWTAVINDDVGVKTFLYLNTVHVESSREEFWSDVEQTLPDYADKLKKGVQILSLNGMQPEMTATTFALLNSTKSYPDINANLTNDVRSLSLLTKKDWHIIVDNVCNENDKLCVPLSIVKQAEENDRDPKDDYASKLFDITTNVFATTVIKNQLGTDGEFYNFFGDDTAYHIHEFLNSKPEFDFRTSSLWDYTDEEVPFRSAALPIQNMMRLTAGKPYVVTALIIDGMKSSGDIVEMSQEAFVQKYTVDFNLMSDGDARVLYARAHQTSLQTIAATATHGGLGDVTTLVWDPSGNPGLSSDPDWQNLFGSLDLCGCSECTSMYSPAAYYTDILKFTRERIEDQTPETRGYKELNERRRPDLTHIELSCKNTNTAIPYVDLVNELLELVILKSAPPSITNQTSISPVPKSYQTTGTSKELNAYPEHKYKNADGDYQTYTDYEKVYDFALSSDISSPKLPFNLALEESRTYLSHLGFKRYDLMDRFKPANYTSVDGINLFNSSAEWLGISKKDAEIISELVLEPFEFYGFVTAPAPTLWYDVLCDGETLQVMGQAQAQGLNTLLERSDIIYKELLQLLNCEFLNPFISVNIVNQPQPVMLRSFEIVSIDANSQGTCDLTKLRLRYRKEGTDVVNPLNTTNAEVISAKKTLFRKWYRFLRLQKATGWSSYQLDMVLASFGLSDIHENDFIQIAKVHKYAKQFKIAPEKLCAIWSNISTVKYIDYNNDSQNEIPTVYDSLFQNKSLKNPVDPAFTVDSITATFELNSGTIIAGLNIKEEELAAIIAYLDIGSSTALTIENLSRIYSIVLLCKGLRYSVEDMLRLFFLFEKDSAAFNQSANGLFGLLEEIAANISIKERIVFSLEETEYLLADKDDNGNYIATDDTIQLFYEGLQTELRKLLEVKDIEPVSTMSEAVSATHAKAALVAIEATTAENIASDTVSNADPSCLPTAIEAAGVIALVMEKAIDLADDLGNISIVDVDDVYSVQSEILHVIEKGAEALYIAVNAVKAANSANDFAQAANITANQKNDAKETASAANSVYVKIVECVEAIKNIHGIALKLNGLPNIVMQYFTAQFSIDNDTARYMLKHVVKIPSDYYLLNALTLPDFINATDKVTPGNGISQYVFSELFDAYRLLRKITFITNRYKLNKDEIVFFIDQADSLDVLELDKLLTAPAALFNNLILLSQLNDWIKVKGILGLRVTEFIELMSKSIALPNPNASGPFNKADWIDCILKYTNWKGSDLNFLVNDDSQNATYPHGLLHVVYSSTVADNDFRHAKRILDLITIMDAIDRIGLSAELIHNVLKSNLVMSDSRYIRTAAKAKHTEDAWLKIAKPLQDVLREKQRVALVAYILARPYILDTNYNNSAPGQPVADDHRERCRTENDLFAYLLIDVEMKPCMATSRIKQAIGSVQLYLDRIILNLENYTNNPNAANHIRMKDDAVQQWKAWRKWYRVWEANRKIFLYPENWIEPELRDDKTPIFKELETALLQDEVKDNIVEDAFRNYLEQLEEIGHLEPVGIYRQQEGRIANTHPFFDYLPKYKLDVTHVFGRTSSLPHRYYYRRYEDSVWTPWEKVNVDIKSDHITPVMWNGKLYLFWLTFQKKKPSGLELEIRKASVTENAKALRFASDRGNVPGTTNWATAVTKDISRPGAKPDYRNPNILIPDTDDDACASFEITLNWSQYKDNKWLANELSKDKMNISPSEIIIGATTTPSLAANTQNHKVIDWLTNDREIKVDEFFKNRIYLFQTIDEPLIDGQLNGDMNLLKEDNGIAFSIMFTPGLDETATGIHRFLWHGDNHITPYVSRNASSPLPLKARGYQLLSPSGTRLNKMKFVEDPYGDGKLKQDKINYIVSTAGGITPNTYFSFESNSIQPGQASITKASDPSVILKKSNNGTYKITARASRDGDVHTHYHIPIANEFLFEDEKNTFYAQLEQRLVSGGSGDLLYIGLATEYRFQTFYHTQIKKLIKALNKGGVSTLLDIQNQKPYPLSPFSPMDPMAFGKPNHPIWTGKYGPTGLVHPSVPNADMQFYFTDAYGTYNWEVFFHAPMLIAQRLSDNQQFEEAQKWYHYVFNPTSTTDADGDYTGGRKRFWKFYPFYKLATQTPQTLTQLLEAINNPDNPAHTESEAQVTKWEKDPFNPHLIARMRILAYMKNVLMKYIDNLIAWGDQLFSRDTIESINEATQLYVLAANLLGKKPQEIPPRAKSKKYSFNDFVDPASGLSLDALSNVMVNIESFFPVNNGTVLNPSAVASGSSPLYGKMFYFCTPKNDILLGYWDKVADRLFKIRNCMNIEGTVRQLPLFEPPIDPAMLVRATAMGVDINTILDSASGASLPHYRFSYMLQKANEFCGEVRGLGNSLLSALEKKDAEQLSLLRSGQELQLMEKITFIKEQQVADAEQALEAVKLTKENTQMRLNYYSSRPFKNANEEKHLQSIQTGMVLQAVQAHLQSSASALSIIPQTHVQSIASGTSFGGQQLSSAISAISSQLGINVAINNAKGSMAATVGGYERRRDDWKFQADSASKELEQLDQQILGAEIRLDIAKKELANHEQQLENTTAVDAYMRSKFTNKELYAWMVSQISTTYFQSYQLAYDLAKKADACYKYELPLAKYPAAGFVTFGYWDSLCKGLMSGEKLQFDLRKMEATYMEENEREFELTKNISLVLNDPYALLELRKNGKCEVYLPEEIYDIDYPGHYNRRIKSVSISIPCIAGPYTTIPATLTLESSYVRKDDELNGVLQIDPSGIGRTMIATSSAQNDAGVFELNFRDERYLPFEGRGAISKWQLSLADEAQVRTFDFDTISDVIMHIRYTAVEGGKPFKEERIENINDLFEDAGSSYSESSLSEGGLILPRYFSLKHEFSSEWYKGFDILVPTASGNVGRLIDLKISSSQFPEYAKGKKITISNIQFVMKPNAIDNAATYYLMLGNQHTNATPIVYGAQDAFVDSNYGLSLEKSFTRTLEGSIVDADLSFKIYKEVGSTAMKINESDLEDIFFIVNYTLTTP